jgi:small subunit ribosomal protein S2
MAPYIYGKRGGNYIIDLRTTHVLLKSALLQIYRVAKKNGKILFVSSKKSARDLIEEYAKKCGQHYINHRWLGGTLTNWYTVSKSIRKLDNLEKLLHNEEACASYTKKELLGFVKAKDKLLLSFGGIRKMRRLPDLVVSLDSSFRNIALQEAKKMNIPVLGIMDTNSDPDTVTYPVPGNDDASRALKMYLELLSSSVLSGLEASLSDANVNLHNSSHNRKSAIDK